MSESAALVCLPNVNDVLVADKNAAGVLEAFAQAAQALCVDVDAGPIEKFVPQAAFDRKLPAARLRAHISAEHQAQSAGQALGSFLLGAHAV